MGEKGKTKLRNPDIHKVDLVDDGANPGAKIRLFKSKTALPGAPAGDNPPKEGTEGFASLVKGVVAKIGKALGWNQEQIDKAMNMAEDAKAVPTAQTFGQKMAERRQRQIYGEIWDYTYALQETMESIIRDLTLNATEKQDLLMGSMDQFVTTITAAIPVWCGGETVEKAAEGDEVAKAGKKISAARMDRLKACRQSLDDLIKEAEAMPMEDDGDPDDVGKAKNSNEEVEDMFDVSKLSPEAQQYIASLEKRATDAEAASQTATTAQKTAETELQKMKDAHPTEEDIYKGMSPAAVQKMKDMEAEIEKGKTTEFINKAKEFEAIGVKADEFGPVLKAVAKACPAQYPAIEKALESAAAIAKTGKVFEEAGAGGEGKGTGSAIEKCNAKAAEIAKSKNVTVAKAWELMETEAPDLLAEYRKEVR